jgi:tetratricopeptide (TPR) repeat protein
MPRYHCTHCEHRFEHQGRRPRCPNCMRQNGLEELSVRRPRSAGATPFKRLGLLVGLLLCLVALAFVIGRWLSERQKGPEPGAVAQLVPKVREGAMVARGIPEAEVVDPFGPGSAIAQVAPAPPAGEWTERARSVAQRLGQRLASIEVDLMGDAIDTPVRTAAELAHAVETKRAQNALSYELAALLLAALRQHGMIALLCEAFEQTAPVRAADPSGALGRYAVAVYPTDEALSEPPQLVFDPARAARLPPWAGGGGDRTMKSLLREPRPLDDVSAAARLYALRALREIEHHARRPERAYELIQWALDASAPAAAVHAARALVLARAGGIEDAVAEAKRAARLRSDAARRTVLASLLLAKRESDDAELELRQALEQDKTFWPAHRSLAALRWMSGDRSGGDVHLERALALAPDEPTVLALVANKHLTAGETDEGLALLRDLAKRRPREQTLLQLYIALVQAGETDEAERVHEQLLKVARDEDQMRELLEQMSGSLGGSKNGSLSDAPAAAKRGKGLTPEGFKLPDIDLDSDPALPGQN